MLQPNAEGKQGQYRRNTQDICSNNEYLFLSYSRTVTEMYYYYYYWQGQDTININKKLGYR